MKKRVVITAVVVAVAIAGSASWLLLNNESSKTVYDTGYDTILPGERSIKDIGGWTRISPPDKDPVYAYTDKIDDVTVGVSQQPLPETFSLEATAKDFNATEELDANGTKVYLGTSAKGPQSAIFTKNSLLVLISSKEKISNESWLNYIRSLN